jgi:predicted HAD superfamily Cof-like phosphohydrolase
MSSIAEPGRSGGRSQDDRPEDAPGPTSRIAGQVARFHRAYGLPVRERPVASLDVGEMALRQALMDEEVGELREAALAGDIVEVADALADIVYIAYGTAHVYGIDLDAVLDEVHASNMTKLGPDGRVLRRADGKVLKGADYRPPDIARVLGSD